MEISPWQNLQNKLKERFGGEVDAKKRHFTTNIQKKK